MRSRWTMLGVAALILGTSVGCSRKPDTLAEGFDEKEMAQATQNAQASFDKFLVRFHNPQSGDEAFSVKVGIKDGSNTEHFWVGNLKLDAEPYSGTIQNEPATVKTVKLGQRYSFSRSDVTDWMYMANRKMQGNYTLKVALKSMSKDKADAVRKKVGW